MISEQDLIAGPLGVGYFIYSGHHGYFLKSVVSKKIGIILILFKAYSICVNGAIRIDNDANSTSFLSVLGESVQNVSPSPRCWPRA